jgi:squalene-hopene/tetraprenyl-beta-curcumene cyclase
MTRRVADGAVREVSDPAGGGESQPLPGTAALAQAINAARDALIRAQSPAGCWLFELEADCTIPAEYILMMHFLDEIEAELQTRLAAYLRSHQAWHGGWPLYFGGAFDLSCSVKAYFALKLAGDNPLAPHMRRARAAILDHGGAARANVFTRLALAMFGQIPWRGTPCLPVELMLLPRWFPFHVEKVSYWSRTVMVPLFILASTHARARNPGNVSIAELFTTPPEFERGYFRRNEPGHRFLAPLFLGLDRILRRLEPHAPQRLRARATRAAEAWMCARLNGEDGLGAIFPAMVNALEALAVLGYPPTHPLRVAAKRALEKLLVRNPDCAYCQPCVSPVWDTALAVLAMQEVDDAPALTAAAKALAWLKPRQLLDQPGDWRQRAPAVRGGGWAFQFENAFYPDLDDTAVVCWAMHQTIERANYSGCVDRGLSWVVGMQSSNGGFAAFDVNNTCRYLNEIPFADHGALLDPPTSDVTARVVTALTCVGRPEYRPAIDRALAFLGREQEKNGSWFGRWGTNYIYGTWSVLTALRRAGIDSFSPSVRRATDWLMSQQNTDGGWGESNDSYKCTTEKMRAPSTPHQTAWAVLALLAAGLTRSTSVERGVRFLLSTQHGTGLWSDPHFTAPGFPRVFYLKYHGYCAYFPLWALAAYRRAITGQERSR